MFLKIWLISNKIILHLFEDLFNVHFCHNTSFMLLRLCKNYRQKKVYRNIFRVRANFKQLFIKITIRIDYVSQPWQSLTFISVFNFPKSRAFKRFTTKNRKIYSFLAMTRCFDCVFLLSQVQNSCTSSIGKSNTPFTIWSTSLANHIIKIFIKHIHFYKSKQGCITENAKNFKTNVFELFFCDTKSHFL